jgi:hypothetical protein
MYRILLLLPMFFILLSCEQEPPMEYSEDKPTVYFYINSDYNLTSITKSFAAIIDSQLIVKIPVKCSGLASEQDRFFKVMVSGKSTAKEGIDFLPLEEQYIFPAGKYDAFVAITLLRTPLLSDSTLVLTLQIDKSDDFNKGEKLRLESSVIFNDAILKPSNWDASNLKAYSKVKHMVFLRITGLDNYPTPEEAAKRKQYFQYLVPRELGKYFRVNYPVYDENGNIIEPW